MSAAYKCDVCGEMTPHRDRFILIEVKPWNPFHVCFACINKPLQEVLKAASPNSLSIVKR